jgi:hypothetical protein
MRKKDSQDFYDIELAPKFTIAKYEYYKELKNRTTVAKAILLRFKDRYLDPIKDAQAFTQMAVACLMIEALESFYRGWETTKGKSEGAFCYFFSRAKEFSEFRDHAEAFYTNVRCGILHQAETTGGWLLSQGRNSEYGTLLNYSDHPEINARRFVEALGKHLNEFYKELCSAPWGSPLWTNVIKKLDSICKHCRKDQSGRRSGGDRASYR